jgi:hypothetical protein
MSLISVRSAFARREASSDGALAASCAFFADHFSSQGVFNAMILAETRLVANL